MQVDTKEYIQELYKKYGEIEIKCDGSKYLPIDAILDFQGDLKKLSDKNLRRLAKSIFYHGYISPFFTFDNGGDNSLLDGHGRLKTLIAIREAGIPIPEQFPVVEIKAGSEKQAREYLLAITSQFGTFQKSVLDDWVADLDAEIAESLRMVDTELELSIASLSDGDTSGDDEVNLSVPEISEEGDIYELTVDSRVHKVICGDATKPETILKLMNGQLADMYNTDPPYNVAYEGKPKEALTIQNDSMEDSNFREFLKDAFTAADAVMKPGAAFYISHADSEGYNFRGACQDINWKVRQCLIWKKNSMVMGRQDYHWKHEPILYGWKPGAGHLWATDRKQTTILEFDRPSKSEDHPTMKPVPLFEYCIRNNTKEMDIVLDSFGGSGTSLVACEKSGRVARICELSGHYTDVIVARFAKWCSENNKVCTITRNGDPFIPVLETA